MNKLLDYIHDLAKSLRVPMWLLYLAMVYIPLCLAAAAIGYVLVGPVTAIVAACAFGITAAPSVFILMSAD